MAKRQVAAERHDAAEGQVAAEGQIAANKAIKVGRATNKANELQFDGGNVIIYSVVIYFSFGLLILYSLTKYSAIFAEVKGYFGITAPNNQLGPMSLFFLKSNNQLECLESG